MTGLQEQRERAIKFGHSPDKLPPLSKVRRYAESEARRKRDVHKARVGGNTAVFDINAVFDGRGVIGDALAQLGREIVVSKAVEVDRSLQPNSGEPADVRNNVLDSIFSGVFRLKNCRG